MPHVILAAHRARRIVVGLTLWLSLYGAIDSVDEIIAAEKGSRRVVAVAPLHAAGDDAVLKQLAVSLTDVVASLLAEDRNVTVVERKRLTDLLAEQKLQASGLVDLSTAVRIGKLLGADLVLNGSVVQEQSSLRLVLNVIAVAGQEVRGTIDLPLGRQRVAEDLLAAGPKLAELVDVQLAAPSSASLDDSPVGRVHLLRGMSCYAARLPDQAVVHLLRAVHTDPRLIESRLWIARSYLETNEPEKAKLELARVRTHSAAVDWRTEIELLTQAIATAESAAANGRKP